MIFDESGFVKKGDDSVGVSRQYCGSIGKVDNCQVGVFAAYASRHGYAFLDKRLYVPEKWFEDDYQSRREKCKVPEDLTFKTKPQLAAEMYRDLRAEETIPFKYVVADSIYGANPDFIAAIEEKVGSTYFVSPSDTLCWLQRPSTEERQVRGKGDSRVKSVVPETEKKPVSFAALVGNINSFFEDADHNTTRFLVLAREPEDTDPTEGTLITTLVFRVRNVPAALYKALGGLATNGVNMTKLESYIEGGGFHAAMFFAEIEGHPEHRNVKLALEELAFFSASLRVLGVYPADPFRRGA